jgi:hypothetical protein
MFSTGSGSRHTFSKGSGSRWTSPSQHVNPEPAKGDFNEQQCLHQTKSMNNFYTLTTQEKKAKLLLSEGRSTASRTGFYHKSRVTFSNQAPSQHTISKDMGCPCRTKLCSCGLHSLTGYVPVSATNTHNQMYFNRTIKTLNDYHANPHDPENCNRCHLHM